MLPYHASPEQFSSGFDDPLVLSPKSCSNYIKSTIRSIRTELSAKSSTFSSPRFLKSSVSDSGSSLLEYSKYSNSIKIRNFRAKLLPKLKRPRKSGTVDTFSSSEEIDILLEEIFDSSLESSIFKTIQRPSSSLIEATAISTSKNDDPKNHDIEQLFNKHRCKRNCKSIFSSLGYMNRSDLRKRHKFNCNDIPTNSPERHPSISNRTSIFRNPEQLENEKCSKTRLSFLKKWNRSIRSFKQVPDSCKSMGNVDLPVVHNNTQTREDNIDSFDMINTNITQKENKPPNLLANMKDRVVLKQIDISENNDYLESTIKPFEASRSIRESYRKRLEDGIIKTKKPYEMDDDILYIHNTNEENARMNPIGAIRDFKIIQNFNLKNNSNSVYR